MSFFSGIPLLLTSSTLAFWLSQSGVDLVTVGFTGLVALPYSAKFLWAPLIDNVKIPFLTSKFGHDRAWIFFSQSCICVCLLLISEVCDQGINLQYLIIVASSLVFFAATMEMTMMGYTVRLLKEKMYGYGEAVSVLGYRFGILVGGAGALYLSTAMSWQYVYKVMAVISSCGLFVLFFLKDSNMYEDIQDNEYIEEKNVKNHDNLSKKSKKVIFKQFFVDLCIAIVMPFKDLGNKKNWAILLSLMFLGKAGDNLIGNMHGIFCAELGFSKLQIANAAKSFGMLTSIVGGILSGFIIFKIGVTRSMLYGSIMHAFSFLMYIILYHVGPDICVLYLVVAIEHATGSLRTSALLSYQMTVCSRRHATTQMAILMSMINLSRTVLSSFSGLIVESVGWENFFLLATLFSLPVVILILFLERQTNSIKY